MQQAHHALTLRTHRSALREVRHRLRHVEEIADPPGRRRIDDDGVVHPLAGLVGAHHTFLDLAGQQHVPKPPARWWWRTRWHRTCASHARRSEVVEHLEIFEERGLDVDGQRHDLPAALGGRDFRLLRRQRGGTSKSWAIPCRPSTSTSNTRRPPSASARANAAATVDFPVPPFPETKCSRARAAFSGHVGVSWSGDATTGRAYKSGSRDVRGIGSPA